jgi:hypothetical protein
MSNSQSIAAVTATLQYILLKGVTADPDLNDTSVSALPLDKARSPQNNANQLNVFLYQIMPNLAWRNGMMPRQTQAGETAISPLPLSLYYLLSAYGRDNDATQPYGHQLMGKAMSLLYDNAVLSAEEIRAATSAVLPNSDLDQQIERVRITLQPLSIEEISKLWTGFATQYRLSAAYEVSVALIESTRAAHTPLPVLTRGQADRGVASQPSLLSPFPTLEKLTPPLNQTSVRLGEVLTVTGVNLGGSNVGVVFNHPRWSVPVEIPPDAGATDSQLTVTIPNQPATWPAGFYTINVTVQRPNDSYRRTTNLLSFPLAPSLTIAPASAPAGDITYPVTASPEVWPEQRASLLFGDQEILADPHPAQTGTLTFQATAVTAGDYYVRLRVDGVDSILIDRSVTPPLFDSTQKVTVV